MKHYICPDFKLLDVYTSQPVLIGSGENGTEGSITDPDLEGPGNEDPFNGEVEAPGHRGLWDDV